jgi:hypothetical protein
MAVISGLSGHWDATNAETVLTVTRKKLYVER